MLLKDVFDQQSIKLNLESKTKEAVFTELIDAIVDIRPELDRDEIFAVVYDREIKMNTSVAPGVAVPHRYYLSAHNVFNAIGISQNGRETFIYFKQDFVYDQIRGFWVCGQI